MFSKDEIRDFYNKGFTAQAYKAIIEQYAESFEKLDFKVAFAKMKEELDLPLSYNTLYMAYYRRRKEKEREKKNLGEPQPLQAPKATAPGDEREEAVIREKLDQLDQRNPQVNQWDF
jgi:IS30 family transposase